MKDSGVELKALKVDGGAVANNFLMEFQADILGVPCLRPVVAETTALGAAYLAGLAVGYWSDLDEIAANWQVDKEFVPDGCREGKNFTGLEAGCRALPGLGRRINSLAGQNLIIRLVAEYGDSHTQGERGMPCDPSRYLLYFLRCGTHFLVKREIWLMQTIKADVVIVGAGHRCCNSRNCPSMT